MPGVFDAAGFEVIRMADAFPDDGQHIGDDAWIEQASEEGWVALTKDTALVRDHAETRRASTLRVFALPSGNLTGPEMAQRFELNLNRIVQRSRKPGPFVDVVHPDRLERRWPRASP